MSTTIFQVLKLINRLSVGESFRAYRSQFPVQGWRKRSFGFFDPGCIEGSEGKVERSFNNSSSSRKLAAWTHPAGWTAGWTRPDLTIPVYAVIPLSAASGIIEWVSGCDTLHSLIAKYRQINNTRLSQEHDIVKKSFQKYEDLPLLQKVRGDESAAAA